ncbi:MAG: Flp family type IVb pilin [Bacteroidota bacterium]
MKKILEFINSEKGATAVEYGLMIALIAVVIIAGVSLLGSNTRDKYSMVGSVIGAAS